MYTCKQVSKALAGHRYQDLSKRQQCLLRFHLWLCNICGPYNKEILALEETVQGFLDHEQSNDLPERVDAHLSDEVKKRIQEKLLNTP